MQELKWGSVFTTEQTLFAAKQTGLAWKDILKSKFQGELGEEHAGFYCATKQKIHSDYAQLVRIRVTNGLDVIQWEVGSYRPGNRLEQIRDEYSYWGEGVDGDLDRDLPEMYDISLEEYRSNEEKDEEVVEC